MAFEEILKETITRYQKFLNQNYEISKDDNPSFIDSKRKEALDTHLALPLLSNKYGLMTHFMEDSGKKLFIDFYHIRFSQQNNGYVKITYEYYNKDVKNVLMFFNPFLMLPKMNDGEIWHEIKKKSIIKSRLKINDSEYGEVCCLSDENYIIFLPRNSETGECSASAEIKITLSDKLMHTDSIKIIKFPVKCLESKEEHLNKYIRHLNMSLYDLIN